MDKNSLPSVPSSLPKLNSGEMYPLRARTDHSAGLFDLLWQESSDVGAVGGLSAFHSKSE